eukprot:Opistho-1_new@76152
MDGNVDGSDAQFAPDGDVHARPRSPSPQPQSPVREPLEESMGAVSDTKNGDTDGAHAAAGKGAEAQSKEGDREKERDRDRDTRDRSRERDDRDRRDYRRGDREDGSVNPGNNLYVTCLSTRTTEDELRAEFAKFGEITDLQIVCDPHTRVSRGFAFVTMREVADAEKATEALKGFSLNGRAMMIEKARRGRPRTPTPGRYVGEDGNERPRERPERRDRRDTHYTPSYNDSQRYTPNYGDRGRDSRDDYRYGRDNRYRDYDRGRYDGRGAYPYDYDRPYDRSYDRYDRYDRPAAAYDRRSPGYMPPPSSAYDHVEAYTRLYAAAAAGRVPGAYDRYADVARAAYDRDRYAAAAAADPRAYDARAAAAYAYPPAAYDRYDRR